MFVDYAEDGLLGRVTLREYVLCTLGTLKYVIDVMDIA